MGNMVMTDLTYIIISLLPVVMLVLKIGIMWELIDLLNAIKRYVRSKE